MHRLILSNDENIYMILSEVKSENLAKFHEK
jgi:hypothetical protein